MMYFKKALGRVVIFICLPEASRRDGVKVTCSYSKFKIENISNEGMKTIINFKPASRKEFQTAFKKAKSCFDVHSLHNVI